MKQPTEEMTGKVLRKASTEATDKKCTEKGSTPISTYLYAKELGKYK